MPPPSAEDERLRVARAPMDGAARRAMFMAFAPGLVGLIIVYVGLTALRDFRDNFAVEIWNGLGFTNDAEIFTLSELPVAVIVLLTLALVMFIRDNRRAFLANLLLVAVGLALAGLSSLAFQTHLIGPIAWMIALGAGLYLGYTPFNALLFDRFIAASGRTGTAGFLIYVADACGYMSSVALLVLYNFVGVKISWVQFLIAISYAAALAGLGLAGRRRLLFPPPSSTGLRKRCMIASLDDIERLYFSPGAASTMAKASPRSSMPLQSAESGGSARRRPKPDRRRRCCMTSVICLKMKRMSRMRRFDLRHEMRGRHGRWPTLFGEDVWRAVARMWRPNAIFASWSRNIVQALSDASQTSLALQGGAFDARASGMPSNGFPIGRKPSRCRRFDDMGKRDDFCGRPFADFRVLLKQAARA